MSRNGITNTDAHRVGPRPRRIVSPFFVVLLLLAVVVVTADAKELRPETTLLLWRFRYCGRGIDDRGLARSGRRGRGRCWRQSCVLDMSWSGSLAAMEDRSEEVAARVQIASLVRNGVLREVLRVDHRASRQNASLVDDFDLLAAVVRELTRKPADTRGRHA